MFLALECAAHSSASLAHAIPGCWSAHLPGLLLHASMQPSLAPVVGPVAVLAPWAGENAKPGLFTFAAWSCNLFAFLTLLLARRNLPLLLSSLSPANGT